MTLKEYNAYEMEPTGPLIFNAGFGRDMGFFFSLVLDALPSIFFGYSGFLLSSQNKIK